MRRRQLRLSVQVLRPLVVLAAATALLATAPPARAAVFDLPPFTILRLGHGHGPPSQDACLAVSTDYRCRGFSAQFETGDTLRVRLEPIPQMKFMIHAPGASGQTILEFDFFWVSSEGGPIPPVNPYSVRFEDLHGEAPVEVFSDFTADESRVRVHQRYSASTTFDCTAIVLEIVLTNAIEQRLRDFEGPYSQATVVFGARWPFGAGTGAVLEIVPVESVPVRSLTWGRIKSNYRRGR